MSGKWQRLYLAGRPFAYLSLPHGVSVVVEPARAQETGARLWYVDVTQSRDVGPVPRPRRWLCTKWHWVRQVIRDELEAMGAAA